MLREDTEERRPPVVKAVAAEKVGVRSKASPALTDKRGVEEIGRLWGQTE
jgi:hypothetical protein